MAYNDFCVNAVLYVNYNTTTAQLGGKDSTDYVVKLVDIGLENAYEVNSTQLYVISMFDVEAREHSLSFLDVVPSLSLHTLMNRYGLADNEVKFDQNITYSSSDQEKWHAILLDLGLLTLRGTSVYYLGGKDTETYILEILRLFWDVNGYTPSSHNDNNYATCLDGISECTEFNIDLIGGYLHYTQLSEVVSGVEAVSRFFFLDLCFVFEHCFRIDLLSSHTHTHTHTRFQVVIDQVEQTMITLVEENMVPLAEEGIISKIEEYGEQYVRMALILNGYTVLDAFQGMLCWSFGDVVTLERLFSLSQYFVCWSFSFSLSLFLSIYLSIYLSISR